MTFHEEGTKGWVCSGGPSPYIFRKDGKKSKGSLPVDDVNLLVDFLGQLSNRSRTPISIPTVDPF
jgi:hypothetical protein